MHVAVGLPCSLENQPWLEFAVDADRELRRHFQRVSPLSSPLLLAQLLPCPCCSNANVNPDFASFSAVYLKYCDGASVRCNHERVAVPVLTLRLALVLQFSGDRYDGINVQGSTIWMRGHRIVNVLYNYLNTQRQSTLCCIDAVTADAVAGWAFVCSQWACPRPLTCSSPAAALAASPRA